MKGLAVAVPEGVVVELKQPQGGFVFQRHGSRTLLEEVEALKVRELPPHRQLHSIAVHRKSFQCTAVLWCTRFALQVVYRH